jgi:hypothetical protein
VCNLGKLKGEGALAADIATNTDWMTIPYKCNRGIIFDGDMPHSSAPVQSIADDGMYRVILGLNCFTETVGECCLRAPEHSDAFNRTIKMYQSMSTVGFSVSDTLEDASSGPATSSADCGPEDESRRSSSGAGPAKGKSFTIEEVKNNPFLKKLVLAAAKAKKQSQL